MTACLVWNGSLWRHLTQDSGLIWNDLNSDKIATGPDGSIWIGTSGGLGHLMHPENVLRHCPAAALHDRYPARRAVDSGPAARWTFPGPDGN